VTASKASLYTKSADRVRLAREAIGKLLRNVEWCGQEDSLLTALIH
jgi:hypothetical protein